MTIKIKNLSANRIEELIQSFKDKATDEGLNDVEKGLLNNLEVVHKLNQDETDRKIEEQIEAAKKSGDGYFFENEEEEREKKEKIKEKAAVMWEIKKQEAEEKGTDE